MDDALLVRRLDRLRDLAGHAQRLSNGDGPACQALGQVLAVHQLHHQRADGRLP